MPDANDLDTFWHNIKTGRDSIREVPPDRWLLEDHYDPDPKAPDKTYCKIGAWIDDFDFNPLKFRIPPKVAAAMDPVQKWVVESTRQALADSGYDRKDFNRNRTAVIIGNALAGELQHITNHRVYLPRYMRQLRSTQTFQELPEEAQQALIKQFESTFIAGLPTITEDTLVAGGPGGRDGGTFGETLRPGGYRRGRLKHVAALLRQVLQDRRVERGNELSVRPTSQRLRHGRGLRHPSAQAPLRRRARR
jgi:hypothetical protein